MSPRRTGLAVAAVVAALAALVVARRAAFAQSKDVTVKRIDQLNARAMEDYDSLEFDSARKQALEGLDMAKKSGLEGDPVAARLHVTLGVIYVAGLKDPYRGFQEFRKALQIDPTSQIDPSVATPELQEIFQNARDSLKAGGPKPGPGPGPTETPSSVTGLQHAPIDEARAGFPIVVRAEVGDDVGAKRVLLKYRPQGRETYQGIDMQRVGRQWSAQIPGDAVQGRSLHYFIEAQDVRARPVAQSGSEASPNIISLMGGGKVLPPRPGVPPKKKPRPRPDEEQEEEEEEEAEEGPPGEKKFSVSLLIGTGAGLVGFGSKSENIGAEPDNTSTDEITFGCPIEEQEGCEPVQVTTGFALAPFHIAVEPGYKVNEQWAVGLLAQIQLVSGNEFKQYDKKTFLVEARVKRYFGEGALRFYLSGGFGGGQMTHGVNLGADGGDRRDTVTSGKAAVGLGGGLAYGFGERWAAVAELNTLTMLPTNPTFNVDLNFGPEVRF